MKKKRQTVADDDLLDKCISDQAIDRPIFLFICCALITITPPAYIYLTIFTFDFFDDFAYSPYMVVIFPLISIYFLIRSYDVMFNTEYTKRFVGASDSIQSATNTSIRSTVALAWTIFFVNVVYLLLMFFLQLYLFARIEAFFNYMLSFSIASAAVYILALKNDESFHRRRNKM